MALPAHIRRAIRCGPVPKIRDWRSLPIAELTRAERMLAFAEAFLIQPEGDRVGQPFRWSLFQELFVYAVYDNPAGTRRAYLSIARKNGKTGAIAALVAGHIAGPEAVMNSRINSGARSRDQAAEVFNYLEKMILMSPDLGRRTATKPSAKQVTGIKRNVTYRALAADAKRGHGGSPRVLILDEVGQVDGPTDAFIDSQETAQGAYEDALLIAISTQAPTDRDLFSTWLDDAERSQDPTIVSHVYEAPEDCKIDSKRAWRAANPALGDFRSIKDMQTQCAIAQRLPANEGRFRNLNLNQRIAADNLLISPTVWGQNTQKPDLEVFQGGLVSCGLDLSKRDDLTAAVLAAADDDGVVHLIPHVYTPRDGLLDRSKRDGAPYDLWVREGLMHAIPGPVVDYDVMLEHLQDWCDEHAVRLDSVNFDPWRADVAQAAADRVGFAQMAEWVPVGQSMKPMSPRIEAFMALLLKGQARHGAHPLLTMAAANAIAIYDKNGNVAVDKSKSTQRIDPLVAAILAAYPVSEGDPGEEFSAAALIG